MEDNYSKSKPRNIALVFLLTYLKKYFYVYLLNSKMMLSKKN